MDGVRHHQPLVPIVASVPTAPPRRLVQPGHRCSTGIAHMDSTLQPPADDRLAPRGSLPRAWDGFDAYLFDVDGTLLNCKDAVHFFAFRNALRTLSGRELNLDGVTAHG